MANFVSIKVDSKFEEAMNARRDKIKDLRPAFETIIKSWFKGNKAIFTLKGPGQYADLSPNYKKEKQKAVGFIYPILRRTGALERTLTQRSAGTVLMTEQSLALGTSIPYAKHLHFGTKHMPARSVIILGAEQTDAPSGELNRRQETFIKIIDSYIRQVLRDPNNTRPPGEP